MAKRARLGEKARKLLLRPTVLPGFRLTLAYTVLYLTLIVLVPLSALLFKAATADFGRMMATLFQPRILSAFRVSFGTALLAAATNALLGLLVAWVLTRYSFPGRRLIDAIIDLPFAFPTAVAGITWTSLLTPSGWLGRPLAALGVQGAFTPLGITIALLFVGFPFVVRCVQPVLENLDPEIEEAAASLGASRLQVLLRVIWPEVRPALIAGVALAFARGIGEYGSVVFVSGNLPFRTETLPFLIVVKLEEYDYVGASALAVVMLGVSLFVLLVLGWWERRSASLLQ
ncbi:sulfate ABC transporter permease subunit CysT [Candidatus Methylacidithermus pantelleriae]|uniref:Sulfate transport system permease protein CysT n=1 Tax=Candidatus Methylacidithermus pantelleriae TaxID=2744239 RepID=A0A8J2FU12_9BACT|nr:sulfate ABC transporter permease subunit CysT [Candidatus Methylacidithermus pantelleriae]CAF0703400.1 Sulfate ABC transporter, permease protein [Candidatus Methylacidithermus pantelleriae]